LKPIWCACLRPFPVVPLVVSCDRDGATRHIEIRVHLDGFCPRTRKNFKQNIFFEQVCLWWFYFWTKLYLQPYLFQLLLMLCPLHGWSLAFECVGNLYVQL
jgi:hypothetical protein